VGITLRKYDDVPRLEPDRLLIQQAAPARALRYNMKLDDMLRGGHDEGLACPGRGRLRHPRLAHIQVEKNSASEPDRAQQIR